jgi:LysM repeat protein
MMRSHRILSFLLLGLAASLYFCSPQTTPAPLLGSTATVEYPSPETSESELVPQSYDWRGTTLTLAQPLPDSPAEAGVFLAQPEAHATLEEARALADQLGMQGEVYETRGDLGTTSDFLIADGNQRLTVRSDGYFYYSPNFSGAAKGIQMLAAPEAAALIGEFMQSHGFDFDYRVEPYSAFGYYALPVDQDGIPLWHEYFRANGLWFTFNDEGIASISASLIEKEPVGNFGIITAEEALQKLLDPSAAYGLLESGHTVSRPRQEWVRVQPKDQTITIYLWMSSVRSLQGGAPLVTLDGFTVTGNVSEVSENLPLTFVEATGQFQSEDGVDVFVLESWNVYAGFEEGWLGTLQREGEQVILVTEENTRLTLPDVPSDVPLPMDNAYVVGAVVGDTFEWTRFDMGSAEAGGGGWGGGLGLYQLNLSGTPMPLPTPFPEADSPSGAVHAVQNGETLSSIAAIYGTTVEELMTLNGLTEEVIFDGQLILVPILESELLQLGQRIEGQRGLLNVYIFNKPDGSQRTEYTLTYLQEGQPFSQYILLEGNDLDALQGLQNRPVEVWGSVDRYDDRRGIAVVSVERFEIPFPDLQFTVLKGTTEEIEIGGEPAALLTTNDGREFVLLDLNGQVDRGNVEFYVAEEIYLEALAVPDETMDGYATIRVFSTAVQLSEKPPVELPITADQPYISDELPEEIYVPPTAMIESVQLVYFTPDPRYDPVPSADPAYVQPMWRFYGHFSNGDEFEILVQALKAEFLSPEIQVIEGPG